MRKEKKSVIQNNINIGKLVGNLHIGPSFTALASSSQKTSRVTNRVTPEERHRERCLNSNRMIEDEELEPIADSLEQSWKNVGERLRLSPDHLNYLERENFPAVRNRNAPYRMLYFWTQKNDKNATVGKLTKALYKAGDHDTIKKMRP